MNINNFINAHQNVLAFIVVILCVFVYIYFSRVINEEERKKRCGFIAVIYGCWILRKTVFSRSVRSSEINLNFLWSYRAWLYHQPEMFSQIYLNIMLYIPFGIFAEGVVSDQRKKDIIFPVIVGVLLSAVTEILQLTLKRGMFELDDIFNNTIGAVLGMLIVRYVDKKLKI